MTSTFITQSNPLRDLLNTRVANYGEEDRVATSALKWEANQQFIAMLNGYRRSGGLAQAREVASMCSNAENCTLAQLLAGCVNRELVSVDWQSRIWIPLFQFNRPNMSLRDGLRDVLAELAVVFNAWDVALWFSQPNPWLFDETPADVMALSMQDVMHAARAERYVAAG